MQGFHLQHSPLSPVNGNGQGKRALKLHLMLKSCMLQIGNMTLNSKTTTREIYDRFLRGHQQKAIDRSAACPGQPPADYLEQSQA